MRLALILIKVGLFRIANNNYLWGNAMKFATMLSRLLIIAAAMSASVANASPLTWTLQGAIFTDGASASGTLVTDSITGDLLGFNVTTSAGDLPGFVFDSTSSTLYGRNVWGSNPNSYVVTRNSPFATPYFNFSFVSALTAPGTVAFAVEVGGLGGSWECNNCNNRRDLVSGSVTTAAEVPEPAPLALMGLAFGAALLARRRQK